MAILSVAQFKNTREFENHRKENDCLKKMIISKYVLYINYRNQESQNIVDNFENHVADFNWSANESYSNQLEEEKEVTGPNWIPNLYHASVSSMYEEWVSTHREKESRSNCWRRSFSTNDAKYLSRVRYVCRLIDQRINNGAERDAVIGNLNF